MVDIAVIRHVNIDLGKTRMCSLPRPISHKNHRANVSFLSCSSGEEITSKPVLAETKLWGHWSSHPPSVQTQLFPKRTCPVPPWPFSGSNSDWWVPEETVQSWHTFHSYKNILLCIAQKETPVIWYLEPEIALKIFKSCNNYFTLVKSLKVLVK